MTQLDLFSAPDVVPLTVADIDEWIAVTRGVANPHVATHYPHEWARLALAALLGEEIPDRRLSTRELLDMLTRARSAASRPSTDTHPDNTTEETL